MKPIKTISLELDNDERQLLYRVAQFNETIPKLLDPADIGNQAAIKAFLDELREALA